MKIIQSFAQFEEGSPYMTNKKHDPRLNFYSFFLSYLTLKKYYGSVTMYANKSAVNSLIKYIPYDEVVVKENNNKFDFWNKFKVDVIRETNEDFIHVDSDVFLFDDLFRPFINDNNYQLIIQDIIPENKNFLRQFFYDNIPELKKCFNVDENIKLNYDGRCVSCGVFGMKKDMKEKYMTVSDNIYHSIVNGKLKNVICQTMIYEELTAYLVAMNNGFNIYDVVPHKLSLNYGLNRASDISKYTHMWFDSKFDSKNIGLMKNKVRKEFPDSYHLIEKYDRDIMRK
jgi:hypothetical protein